MTHKLLKLILFDWQCSIMQLYVDIYL